MEGGTQTGTERTHGARGADRVKAISQCAQLVLPQTPGMSGRPAAKLGTHLFKEPVIRADLLPKKT